MPKIKTTNYDCPKCGKHFKQKSNYNDHVYKRKVSCLYTTKKMMLNGAKKPMQSMQSHAAKFQCLNCNKSYTQKGSLNRHIRNSCTSKTQCTIFGKIKNDIENDTIIEKIDSEIDTVYNIQGQEKYLPKNPCRTRTFSYLHDADSYKTRTFSYQNRTFSYLDGNPASDFEGKNDNFDENFDDELSKKKKIYKKKICAYCKKLISKSNYSKHINNSCKEVKRLNAEKESIYLNKIREMEGTIRKLESNHVSFNDCNNTNTTQNNSTNIQNNVTIKVVAFGKEELYDIFNEDAVKKYISRGYQSVKHLINDTHFNKNRPELQNVYISNMRDVYAMTFNGTDWVLMKKDEVIDQLFDDKQCFLINNYKEINKTLAPNAKKKFDRFLAETDSSVINDLKNDIKLLLYNKRKIPLASRGKKT